MWMAEHEYIFATNTQKKLKTKIKGRIYAEITGNDELYVSIANVDNTVWEYVVPDFSTKLVIGYWTSEDAANEICKAYRSFIFEQHKGKYFYND